MKIPRILLAAPASGSGKTAVSCGLMAAFQDRGLKVRSCKCGPDYIDPMFHREVLGVDSRNLDLFFSGNDKLRSGFLRHARGADLTVVEGVMGYYDGMFLDSPKGSSYDVARGLDIPVILVMPCRGASLSLAAQVKGMVEFMPDSRIRGIILNRVSAMLYPRLKEMLKTELKKMGHEIPVVGYVPEDEAFSLESRHLGLVTPDGIQEIRNQLLRAGEILSRTVDLEQVLAIAGNAGEMPGDREKSCDRERSCGWNMPFDGAVYSRDIPDSGAAYARENRKKSPGVRIAVARDEAFCFYYKDNLELLEDLGCELVPFSPLRDRELPEHISGLILGGGYPELYGEMLAANTSMLSSVRRALEQKMPTLAECGGFMYLHEEMEDQAGRTYSLVGAIKGRTFPTGKLVRFGYVSIGRKSPEEKGEAEESTELRKTEGSRYLLPGEQIRGHEFHYWDSTDSGEDCLAVKPDGRRSWSCIHAEGSLFAGYPHLYLPSNRAFAERFVQSCICTPVCS